MAKASEIWDKPSAAWLEAVKDDLDPELIKIAESEEILQAIENKLKNHGENYD